MVLVGDGDCGCLWIEQDSNWRNPRMVFACFFNQCFIQHQIDEESLQNMLWFGVKDKPRLIIVGFFFAKFILVEQMMSMIRDRAFNNVTS